MSIEVGNTVRLKSGGEIMTVEKVDDEGVHCVWHDIDKRQQKGTFDPALLYVGYEEPAMPQFG